MTYFHQLFRTIDGVLNKNSLFMIGWYRRNKWPSTSWYFTFACILQLETMMSTAKYWWQIAVHRIRHHNLKKGRETQSMYHLLGTLYMYLPSSILGCLVYDPGENIFFRDIKYLLFVKRISSFAPIPPKINLENIKSICYNPRKNFFHTMCHFLCQAVKIQILSFFFFQSLPPEPYASPSTKP